MDTVTLVMILLCIVYIPIWVWVWRKPEAAEKIHLVKYGPLVMIKTHLGIKTMDKLGKYKRFWRVFGFISKLISAILFFLMMYMLIVAVLNIPSRVGTTSIGLQYALAIPGFNPMLPLTYGIVALFFAMVVHEMAHGIQSRANDCAVDSTGLLYGVVPWGAFCEPNEEQLKKLPRRPQMDIYSAGISVNTFWAVISIVLMLLICSGISAIEIDGVDEDSEPAGIYSVDKDSPGYYSDIPTSALITGIRMSGETDYHDVKVVSNDRTTSVTYADGTVMSPANTYELRYELEDGVYYSSTAIQMGAFIKTVTGNSPASSAGLKPSTFLESMTITHDGVDTTYSISSSYDFIEVMKTTIPGDLAVVTTVTSLKDGDIVREVHDQVSLTASGSIGFFGLSVTNAGFTYMTPSAMLEKATHPFANCTTPISYVDALFSYLSGPFNGLDPIPNSITWWYDASDLTWITVKMLYWIFWLDLLLAISNALPAFPFDGGYLFEGGLDWLMQRLGFKDEEKRKKMSESASSAISSVVLIAFVLVIIVTFVI